MQSDRLERLPTNRHGRLPRPLSPGRAGVTDRALPPHLLTGQHSWPCSAGTMRRRAATPARRTSELASATREHGRQGHHVLLGPDTLLVCHPFQPILAQEMTSTPGNAI